MSHTAAEMVCRTNFYMIAVLLANEMTDVNFAFNFTVPNQNTEMRVTAVTLPN